MTNQPTDEGPTIEIALDKATLEAIDERAENAKQSRPDMIRRLIGIGLNATKGLPTT
jgi:hypothetical protein